MNQTSCVARSVADTLCQPPPRAFGLEVTTHVGDASDRRPYRSEDMADFRSRR